MKAYAVDENNSLGRSYLEPKSPLRNDFQRDRDRIIHSSAFRRLMYKTQVFVNHEGDMFRTRLTHSLEVAQISRGIARSLSINEDLCETIALAHDLGHAPFGHAGQDELNRCMKNLGGFEHNMQSLRVVDHLERRYAKFAGLNLTFESREGILKHCSQKNALLLGSLGERFINSTHPSLEAQAVDLADAIAYNMHDIEDGYRSGILDLDQLQSITLFHENFLKVKKNCNSQTDEKVLVYETLRLMMFTLINDVTSYSSELIETKKIQTIDDVRTADDKLIQFSAEYAPQLSQCQQVLRTKLYRDERIVKMTHNAFTVVKHIFDYFLDNLDLIPSDYLIKDNPGRSVSDYISGMTDRFADNLYKKLVN